MPVVAPVEDGAQGREDRVDVGLRVGVESADRQQVATLRVEAEPPACDPRGRRDKPLAVHGVGQDGERRTGWREGGRTPLRPSEERPQRPTSRLGRAQDDVVGAQLRGEDRRHGGDDVGAVEGVARRHDPEIGRRRSAERRKLGNAGPEVAVDDDVVAFGEEVSGHAPVTEDAHRWTNPGRPPAAVGVDASAVLFVDAEQVDTLHSGTLEKCFDERRTGLHRSDEIVHAVTRELGSRRADYHRE